MKITVEEARDRIDQLMDDLSGGAQSFGTVGKPSPSERVWIKLNECLMYVNDMIEGVTEEDEVR